MLLNVRRNKFVAIREALVRDENGGAAAQQLRGAVPSPGHSVAVLLARGNPDS